MVGWSWPSIKLFTSTEGCGEENGTDKERERVVEEWSEVVSERDGRESVSASSLDNVREQYVSSPNDGGSS